LTAAIVDLACARNRSLLLLLLLVGVGLTLGACGGSHATSTSHAQIVPKVSKARPEVAGSGPCRISRVAASEPRTPLVPGAPSEMVLCRVAGLPLHPARELLKTAHVQDRPVLERLTRQFNELPPPPKGVTACPSDNGSQIEVAVRYAHRPPMLIDVSLSGCRDVRRGTVTRTALGASGQWLITDLEELIGPVVIPIG